MDQGKPAPGEITITLVEPALGTLEILAEINRRAPAQEAEAILTEQLERERHNQQAALMTDEELDERLADLDGLGRERPDDD